MWKFYLRNQTPGMTNSFGAAHSYLARVIVELRELKMVDAALTAHIQLVASFLKTNL